MIFELIFGMSLFLILFSYTIYPLLIWIIANLIPIKFKKGPNTTKITLLICAYNEEKVIEEKIKNSLQLKGNIEIIIASDGSTDGTDAIVKKYKKQGVILHKIKERSGMNGAINKTWHLVKGDIVVFSDANALFKLNAIEQIVRWFADKRISCVSGELRYIDSKTGIAKCESLYWKYEQFLKRQEGKVGQLLGPSGAIYAIRSNVFKPLDLLIGDDFQLLQHIAMKGYKSVYDPSAVAYEAPSQTSKDEFNMKIRIIANGLNGSFKLWHTFKGLRLFELISHKLLRWFVWAFLPLVFISNMFLLENQVFRFIFALQVVFYLIALLGPLCRKTT